MLRLHAFSPHRLSLAVATSTGEGLVNLPRTWHTCTLEELHILSVQLSVSFLNSRNVTNTAWCWTLSGPWLRLVALRSSSGQTSTQIMYVCHCTWQVLATRPSPCMLVPQVTNAGVRRPKLVSCMHIPVYAGSSTVIGSMLLVIMYMWRNMHAPGADKCVMKVVVALVQRKSHKVYGCTPWVRSWI